ncbi:O-fucosyltransferase 38 isoform X2 [Phragmites australis]|uniref:O-fucosyltransferase 38 isoform X2 n=1 Tax=Phragmites australis TaxID=29695 RepID=UPI002D783030|nr:O-fucosyltransferase 38 isoform X2 [Phragmites australis]
MANPRGAAPPFLHPRLRRLLRSPISRCAWLLLAFAALLLLYSLRQVARVDLRRPDPPRQVSSDKLWASNGYGYHACVTPTSRYTVPRESDHYMTVRSNGGLNQMRTGICDMVAVARLVNATLVIPQLDKRSFWQDTSTFKDIFDEPHFIKALEGDVHIVSDLPQSLQSVPRARKHFTSWSSASYYEELKELWKDHKRLRCRCLYQALRFSDPIEDLGKKLVERLRSRGKFIALHLRYEKDMLAFTGCTYGLSDSEANELRLMRERTGHWKLKDINSTEQRSEGNCPLTPKEVGIFLRAMGYPESTWIYLAAGEIYGGEKYISKLRLYFPNLVSKEALATKEELEKFDNHASQVAALDYIISVESDVFVPSHSGNMAKAVEGHRRFLGHRKTITPDRRGLVELFNLLEKGELMEGLKLSSLVTEMHKYRQGAPRKRYGSLPGSKGKARLRTEESFYENPLPECICLTGKH